MPSLLEALEEKYGLGGSKFSGDDVISDESLVSIFVPKIPPRKCVPTLLVLNDCDIDCAGDSEELKEKCHSVKELDLAQNKLQKWDEIFGILSHMPRVEFLNLSKNRLSIPLLAPPINTPTENLSRLKSLVLNGTCLDWESVETLLKYLPALNELHLSLNDYQNVLIDTVDEEDVFPEVEGFDEEDEKNENIIDTPFSVGSRPNRTDSTSSTYKKTIAHAGLQKLHFTGNPVSDWAEICRLGRVFPKLEALVLAECPLKAVEPVPKPSASIEPDEKDPPYEYFKNLTFLNLSSTKINTWDDIDRLAMFPSLKNLRVQNWPLWDKIESTEHERRQLLIARLPFVEILNGGGKITNQEREDAERAFIRYYMERPESDRPARYNDLIAKHGKLDPLVNIDLRPEKRVKVTFTYGDVSEVRSVDVYRTVVDLKSRLEGMVGLPANKIRLYYVGQDSVEPEVMRFPNKQLYSYNIRSGDQIIIDPKK